MKIRNSHGQFVNLSEGEKVAIEVEERYKYYESLGKRKSTKLLYILLSMIFAMSIAWVLLFSPSNINFPSIEFLANSFFSTKFVIFSLVVGFSAYFTNLFFTYLKSEVVEKADKNSKYGYEVEILLSGYEKSLLRWKENSTQLSKNFKVEVLVERYLVRRRKRRYLMT